MMSVDYLTEGERIQMTRNREYSQAINARRREIKQEGGIIKESDHEEEGVLR